MKASKPARPGHLLLRWLTLAVVVTGAALSWSAVEAYRSYQRTQVNSKLIRLAELRGTIVQLDEVLTMSARMAAATGEPKWEKRYRTFEPALDAAIREVEAIEPDAAMGSATDTANVKLVGMENRAFALVNRHRLDEAQRILSSKEYQIQKQLYAQGMNLLSSRLQSVIQAGTREEQRSDLMRLAVAASIVPLIIVSWLIALRAMVRSQSALTASSLQLGKEVQSLAELNTVLDQKTRESEASRERAEALNRELRQEITERQEAQAAQARMAAILEATSDFVGIANSKQQPIYLNPAARKMIELPESQDLAEVTILDHFTEPSQAIVAEGVRAAQRDGTWTGETVLLSRAGREIPVSQVIVAHPGGAGGGGLLSTIIRDISAQKQAQELLEARVAERTAELGRANDYLQAELQERKRAEAEVRRAREELRNFIDAMSTLAAKVAPDGTLLIANKAALDAAGLPRDEYIETNFLDGPWWGFDDEVQTRAREMFSRAIAGKSVNYDERVFLFGSERTINFSLIPIGEPGGEVEYVVAEGRDITELKLTEQALQQAKAQADAASLAKTEFLSRTSHELRTPLNAILGFGQILAGQDLTPAQQARVQHILRAGQHLLDLINEVLEIARIESGKIQLSLEPVCVRTCVEEVVTLIQPLAAKRGIRIHVDDGPEARPFVWADQQRLKQVLLNLVSNAVKYNHDDGAVTITYRLIPGSESEQPNGNSDLRQSLDQLRIDVTDTGPGISTSALEHLFVPFMRLGAEQSGIEGTGLGLALSRGLIQAMNGTLDVESTPGSGSTFWLELPWTPAPNLQDQLEPDQQGGSSGTDPKVASEALFTLLYIEDNPSNLELIEDIVSDHPSYKLLSAPRGQVGLDLARLHLPDLILLDLHLPDLPGDQVLSRLKAVPATRDIPVVVLSAVAMENEIHRLLAAGAAAYLTKPLDVKTFLSTTASILEQHHGTAAPKSLV